MEKYEENPIFSLIPTESDSCKETMAYIYIAYKR